MASARELARSGPVAADRLRRHLREPAAYRALVPDRDRGSVGEHAHRRSEAGGALGAQVVGRAPAQALAGPAGRGDAAERDRE